MTSATPPAVGEHPAGYVLAWADAHGLHMDWDGQVHPDLTVAQRELRACEGAGYSEYALYSLTRTATTSDPGGGP